MLHSASSVWSSVDPSLSVSVALTWTCPPWSTTLAEGLTARSRTIATTGSGGADDGAIGFDRLSPPQAESTAIAKTIGERIFNSPGFHAIEPGDE